MALAIPTPTRALSDTQAYRCELLTDTLNQYRADVRRMNLLCAVAWKRAVTMAEAGRLWHDLRPVMRALTSAGICWTNVGEVVAWNNYAVGPSLLAAVFISQWRRSPAHWSILMTRRYDRGGGSWKHDSVGRKWAVYYVLDTC
jgi:uncharacterized protein YkwD